MSSRSEQGLAFIVSTGKRRNGDPDRSRIRRHVMLGKNRKAIPNNKKLERCHMGRTENVPNFLRTSPNSVPRRVGSDLSFIEFADTVELSLVSRTLQFSTNVKPLIHPLEPCIAFNHHNVKFWFEPLTFDPLYLNALVFVTHAYMRLFSSQGRYSPQQVMLDRNGHSMMHYTKSLQLLRERLRFVERDTVTNPTIVAVLCLTMHAHLSGQKEEARSHMAGLVRLVALRGGIESFWDSAKFCIELLRCDITLSLHHLTPTSFFGCCNEPVADDLSQIGRLAPFPGLGKTSSRSPELPTCILPYPALHEVWTFLQAFSSSINDAITRNQKFLDSFLLDAMASSMYRLLPGRNLKSRNPSSTIEGENEDQEAIGLGLLAFCSSVFLPAAIASSLGHGTSGSGAGNVTSETEETSIFATRYHGCCLRAERMTPRYLEFELWLRIMGIASGALSEEEGLKGLAMIFRELQVKSWEDAKVVLVDWNFPWINVVHDSVAEKLVHSVLNSVDTSSGES